MANPVCGIDYNLRYIDLAVVSGRALVTAKQYRLGVDLASRIAVIQRALDELICMPAAPSVICMEQPWVREGRGIKSALALHAIPHYVEALAAERGITDVRYVAIATWHSQVLGNGRLSSEAGKVLSVQTTKRLYPGFEPESADQADAVCLATWGVNTIRFRERVGA